MTSKGDKSSRLSKGIVMQNSNEKQLILTSSQKIPSRASLFSGSSARGGGDPNIIVGIPPLSPNSKIDITKHKIKKVDSTFKSPLSSTTK
jgi:hypothetical protein